MVRTTLASVVLSDALATWLALAALAALAANLFLFRFSTGVALGGSRMSPGIALGVPVANLPQIPKEFQTCVGPVMSHWKQWITWPAFPPNLWRLVLVTNSFPVISA